MRRVIGVLVLSLIAVPQVASASAETQARSFVEGAAAMIYACAWPTATYESVSFLSLGRAEGGYDAVFRLIGKSAFDDSDLWVDLAFEFRNGELHDMHVMRHNAILVPPFETCKAMGKLLDDLIKESQSQKPGRQDPRPSAGRQNNSSTAAVCINNAANFEMKYAYRWSGNEWQQDTIAPGSVRRHWWTYNVQVPSFEVTYDDNLAKGVSESRRHLNLSSAVPPVSCSSVKNYSFVVKDNAIGLNSDTWEPGWPHPFAPSVIAGEKTGEWRPAPGYRWYDTADKTGLAVVPENLGITGILIGFKGNGDIYPTVIRVVPGGPAEGAGIHADMEIVRVNGVSTAQRRIDDAWLCSQASEAAP